MAYPELEREVPGGGREDLYPALAAGTTKEAPLRAW